jgi:hypothetical protein
LNRRRRRLRSRLPHWPWYEWLWFVAAVAALLLAAVLLLGQLLLYGFRDRPS